MPADKEPYTVVKPGSQMPRIDLRGLSNFTLMGEGYGSVIQMTGPGGGSWFMIHIGGHADNITVRDLFLDGNKTGLAHPDLALCRKLHRPRSEQLCVHRGDAG